MQNEKLVRRKRKRKRKRKRSKRRKRKRSLKRWRKRKRKIGRGGRSGSDVYIGPMVRSIVSGQDGQAIKWV